MQLLGIGRIEGQGVITIRCLLQHVGAHLLVHTFRHLRPCEIDRIPSLIVPEGNGRRVRQDQGTGLSAVLLQSAGELDRDQAS